MSGLGRRFKHSVKEWIYRVVPPPYRNYSYAQAGEDAVLKFLFDQVGLTRPRYLEIGVFEPIQGNNTYKFYEQGGEGVLVEADESLLPFIRHARPRDQLVHCGVGTGEAKSADFYVFDAKGASTFSKAEALARDQAGPYRIEKIVQVPLLTVNEILETYFHSGRPDFLSIDIEGMDLPVLKTLDFERFPIPVICSETCTFSDSHIKPKNPEIADFMKSRGYFAYADTYVNTLFVNQSWFRNPGGVRK